MAGVPSTLDDLPEPPRGNNGWPWRSEDASLSKQGLDATSLPTISVVTPSYNQGSFIEETIRSVLLQRYPNLEYIVVDGGSTDESIDIIQKYDRWIDDWVSEPDRGQSHAINKGFARASGDIFAWLNSDDFYLPGALRTVGQAFSNQPETEVVVGEAQKVKTDGEVVYTAHVPELSREGFLQWRNGGNFLQPACFFRREAWEECGPLREDLKYCMDVDLWLKMVEKKRFEGIDTQLARAVQHPEAKTTGEEIKTAFEVNLLITEYGGYDIAKEELMEISEQMSMLQKESERMSKIRNNTLYKYILGPIYRLLRGTSSQDE